MGQQNSSLAKCQLLPQPPSFFFFFFCLSFTISLSPYHRQTHKQAEGEAPRYGRKWKSKRDENNRKSKRNATDSSPASSTSTLKVLRGGGGKTWRGSSTYTESSDLLQDPSSIADRFLHDISPSPAPDRLGPENLSYCHQCQRSSRCLPDKPSRRTHLKQAAPRLDEPPASSLESLSCSACLRAP